MIDIEWLRTVQFETDSGHVTELAGIGAQFIVFSVRLRPRIKISAKISS